MELPALTLIDHIRELRRRLIISTVAILIGFFVSYTAYDTIVAILSQPFAEVNGGKTVLYVSSLFEGFTIRMHFGMIGGVILTLPVHLYNVLRFVFPGLKPKERRLIGWALGSSVVLAALSLFFGYKYFIPFAVQTMTSTEFIPKNVGILLNFDQNIFYVFNFLLYGMLTFQLPILLEIMLYLNLISRKTLWDQTRYVIVAIFIIAAIVTPPDIISQSMIAFPLMGLYFLTILIAKLFKLGEG
jgi:sec-independent protein translocase protein TatC